MKRAPFLTNPYGGYRMDGVRRHDQNWSDLYASTDDTAGEFRAFTGILNAALWGALVWLALACFVVILWGVMS
jgi:hypothetical protein